MKKILIVEARFYPEISDLLLEGAKAKIESYGFKNGKFVEYLNELAPHDIRLDYEIIQVSGALEIPAAIALAIESKKYAGYIALGCVIRGETSHYDIVANESARGLMKLSLKKHAIANGILTVENADQAIVRADPKQKDKGGFVVTACLRMIELQKQFGVNDK